MFSSLKTDDVQHILWQLLWVNVLTILKHYRCRSRILSTTWVIAFSSWYHCQLIQRSPDQSTEACKKIQCWVAHERDEARRRKRWQSFLVTNKQFHLWLFGTEGGHFTVWPGKNIMPTSERFELSHEFRIGCSIDRQEQFDLRCVTSSNPTP